MKLSTLIAVAVVVALVGQASANCVTCAECCSFTSCSQYHGSALECENGKFSEERFIRGVFGFPPAPPLQTQMFSDCNAAQGPTGWSCEEGRR